ncbi:MAG: hypothetical protein JNN08_28125 [Bryobacterales bacterium]|nr:hypothetical protein [Bryobacterales bacterium]
MSRKQTILLALALVALSATSLSARNVVVLPTFTGSPTGTATVYKTNPFEPLTTFNISTDAFTVLSRATPAAGDVKYYVISRSGSGSLTILNSSFEPVGNALNLGQNVTAATLTPDGRRLLILYGSNFVQYRTDTDQLIQTNFIDVGPNPRDIAVSSDSSRAFILSSLGQSVTAVDLATNTGAGRISLPGLLDGQGSLAMGPNGMLYVSAVNRVIEVDPRAVPFEGAVRRQFQLPSGNVGRLVFTPDGTRALAVNLATGTAARIYYFQLNYVTGGVVSIDSTDPSLNGFVFDKVFIGSNSLAYAVTSAQSVKPRRMFPIDIPAIVQGSAAQIPTPTLTGEREAFFANKGTIEIVDSVTFSNEYPGAIRGFVSAPLNQLAAAAQNTIYQVVYGGSQPTVSGEVKLNGLPGAVVWAGPATTTETGLPGGVVPMGMPQGAVAQGGRTLPFGVRVINSIGVPMFNVPIVFTSISGGGALVGPATVSTNADGIALVTATAPNSPGEFTINASVQGSGLSTSFTFTVPTTGGGGGDPGTDPGTGSARIVVLEGNGQVLREGEFAKEGETYPKRTRIRLLDASGKAVAGANISWVVSQGGGRWLDGNVDAESRRVTVTDANGETSNAFVAPENLGLGNSFSQSVADISAGSVTIPVFFTTVARQVDGFPNPMPSAQRLTPSNEPPSIIARAGQTLPGAIRYQFSVSGRQQGGLPLQYIGLGASTGNRPENGPVVECAPQPIVLSNEQGIANCDLKISGRAGTALIRLELGGGYTVGNEPFLRLEVLPGEPSRLVKVNGDRQNGNPNANLPAQLIVALDDGGGNASPGATIRWEVIQGSAILANSTTITGPDGRAFNNVRLGAQPGVVLVRATALGGSQPSVTFEATVNVTVGGIVGVSGDRQTTFTNTAFAQPVVVQVNDTRGIGIPGQTVNFTVPSGSATLSSASATSDANGRAQVTVRAGANPGQILVRAALPSNIGTPVEFTLTAQLPGPVINPLDFYNSASGERGAIVPGSLYTMVGSGLAPDLRGCATGTSPVGGTYLTRVAGVEVQFGAVLAPILAVCNQDGREFVNLQAPFELAANSQTSVTVRVGTGSSVVNNVRVLDLQPGTFETSDSLGVRAIALRPNGTPVTPANPARWGELIRFYATGLGAVNPSAFTGVSGVPNQQVVAPIVVGLNDEGVRMERATYQVGSIGVYEIVFEVPQGATTGPARPLGLLVARPNGEFAFPANSPTIAIGQ